MTPPSSPLPPAESPSESPGPAEPFHGPASSRRRFLGVAAAGVASAGTAGLWLARPRDTEPGTTSDAGPTTTTEPLVASADVAGRTLVVVELSGGNDGLATVVPRNAGTLYDRRPSVHVPDEELIDFTDEFGWNPRLERLSAHGVAVVLGLGTQHEPDGSHFEMERRWWSGESSGSDMPTTGFLGRLCDQLADDQPVTGIALGSGANPALLSDKAVTMGLADPDSAWFLHHEDDSWFVNLRRGLGAMSAPGVDDTPSHQAARRGLSDTLSFADALGEIDLDGVRDRYPGSDLGWKFGLAAELIDRDVGLRVLHLTHGGFDTHADQRGEHDDLLEQLSESMSTFLEDIGDRGRADTTLVCTTSEFGRRVPDNDGGTDHGAAGLALLAGPVVAGVHGDMPSLTVLDDDNLVATVDFEQYYATLAEHWFGIPSSEVLRSAARPVDGVIA